MGGEGSDQLFGGDAGLNLDVLTGGEGNDYFYLDANHISSAAWQSSPIFPEQTATKSASM